MRSEERTAVATRKSGPKTLGDVLFADKASARVSENYWVHLVSAIAAGDQLALHALYSQTHRYVFTLIMRITGSRETAEELTVDVFYDVWRRASTFDSAEGSVLGWIMNQARSRAIDRLRHDTRKKRVKRELPGKAPPVRPESIEEKEAERRVQRALETLAPQERQAIETTYFQELSHRDAAEKLGVPLGTVKTRIRSGLARIRRALGETGKPS